MAQKSNFIVRGGLDVSGITKGLAKTQAQLGAFQSSVTKGFNSTQKSLNTCQSGISKAVRGIATVLGALAIGSYIKDSVSEAMKVESAMVQINRIMGDSASEFDNWAQTQAKAFGIAKSEAYSYGATYSNLISTFSSGAAETEALTTQLLQASAVTASATGRSMEDTMERIRSGLLGNTESIEDLGINVNVAMLESTEAFKQFADGKTWNQLSYQVQQQIRLMAILEQANNKYGDSLAGTTATRQMMFLATLKNIKLNLGNAFLPIYNIVLPILNSFASKLEAVTATFASFMNAVFGMDIKTTTSAISSAASATSGLADSTADVGDAAVGSAKKIKNALAGFDEITKLSDNSDSGGGGSGGGGGGASGAADITDGTSPIEKGSKKVSKAVQDMIDKFEAFKEKCEPLTEALKKLWDEGLTKLGGFVAQGLIDFYNKFLAPLGEWAVGEGLPRLVEYLNSALMSVDWDGLNEALSNFWTAIEPYAEQFGEGLIDFCQALIDIGVDALNSLIPFFNGLADALNKGDPENARGLGYALGQLAAGIVVLNIAWSGFKKVAQFVAFMKTLGEIATIAYNGLALLATINPEMIVTLLAGLVENLGNKFSEFIKEKFGTSGYLIMQTITTAIYGAVAGFFIGGPIGAVVGLFAGALVVGFAEMDLGGAIKILFNNIGTWMATETSERKEKVKEIGKRIVDDIKEGMAGLYETGAGAIGRLVAGLESMKLPKIKIETEWITTGLAAKIGQALGFDGFPKLKFKMYEQGGLPDVGEMFIARESGPEMVGKIGNSSAVANNNQIVEAVSAGVANAVASVLGNQKGGNDRPLEINMIMNGTTLGRAFINSINELQKREGAILI